MKKLLILAALSVAFNASAVDQAVDQYLYWMVDESAIIDKGKLPDNFYATIKTGDGTGYLGLYTSPSDSSPYDVTYAVDLSDSMPTFAGFTGTPSTFLIELWADNSQGNWLGQAELKWADVANYVTTGGKGVASPVSVSSFTAVPEPTSGLLLLLGVAGLALRRKNKKA